MVRTNPTLRHGGETYHPSTDQDEEKIFNKTMGMIEAAGKEKKRDRMREAAADDLMERELQEHKAIAEAEKYYPTREHLELARKLDVESKDVKARISAAKARIADIHELRAWPEKIKASLEKFLDQTPLSSDARVAILGDKQFLTDLIKRGYMPGDNHILAETLRDKVAMEETALKEQYPGLTFTAKGEPHFPFFSWSWFSAKDNKVVKTPEYQTYKAFFDVYLELRKTETAVAGGTGSSASAGRGLSKVGLGAAVAGTAVAGVLASESVQPEKPIKWTTPTARRSEPPKQSRGSESELPDWRGRVTFPGAEDVVEPGEETAPIPKVEPFQPVKLPETDYVKTADWAKPTAVGGKGKEDTDTSATTPLAKAQKMVRTVKRAGPTPMSHGTPEEPYTGTKRQAREQAAAFLKKVKAAGPKPPRTPDIGAAGSRPVIPIVDTRRGQSRTESHGLQPKITPEEETAMAEAAGMRRAVAAAVRDVKRDGRGAKTGFDSKEETRLEEVFPRMAADYESTEADEESDEYDSAPKRPTAKPETRRETTGDYPDRQVAALYTPLADQLKRIYFGAATSYTKAELSNWERNIGRLVSKAIKNAPEPKRAELARHLGQILIDAAYGAPGSLDRLSGLSAALRKELGPSPTLDTFDEFLVSPDR